MWRCQVCNYIHQGETAPEKCPKCGAPREKFTALEKEQADKIERSRLGNALLMELDGLMNALAEMAEAGIEDNLDPGCVKLWKECQQFAIFARQSLKAEAENHMAKGKWG